MPGERPQYVRTSSPPQLLHLPPAAALAPRGAAEPPDLDIWRKDGRDECTKRGNGQGYATHCTSGLCNSNGADITRNGAHSVEADRYAPSTVPGFGNEKAKEIEVQSAKQSRNEEEFEVGKTSHKQACSSIDQGAKKKADPAARDDGYPMVEASTSTEELELPHLGVKGTWGSFLPQRPLRVLLVEDDNATRHVVTALLRKCGYEVSTAANGLQAWELMSSSRDIFDVVLTDVIMPVLSGTGLLDKIMRSEAHRDTPVIMMSSHDSLDMVFKCLLKGAKDFLVKPVRKNELRNLWQHVWRKCRNSSRCQSGNRSKSAKLKRAEKHSSSGIDTSSGKDKIDSCRDKKDGGDSDNGSATQGTWMERPNEVASTPQRTVGNLSSTPVGDNNSIPQMHPQVQVKVENLNKHGGESIQVEHPMEHTGIDDTLVNSEGSLSSERSAKAIDLIGTIGRHSIHDQDNESDGGKDELAPRMVEGVRPKTSQTLWLESSPLHRLELTLKRPYSSEDAGCEGDGRRVLRQSGCSAFSRYSGSGTMYERQQNAIYASLPSDKCSLVDGPRGHSASSRGGLGCGNSATSHGMPGPGGRDVNSSTFMASQGDDSLQMTHVSSNNSARISVSPQKMISYGSGQTVGYNLQVYSPYYPVSVPQWSARQSYTAEREMYDNRDHNQDYCSEHHYFNEHAHACDSQEAPSSRCDQDVISENETVFPQSTSDITEIFPNEKVSEVGSTQNGFFSNRVTSLNVTGSNEGSSTHYSNVDGNNMNPISTGDCSLGDAANTDGNSAMTYDGISIVDGGNANGIMGMPDQTRAAQREAALNKFRQKRKVRCFEKKVRYQSRKKLAEQRPRVKGQFVRQAVYEAIVQEPNK